MKNLLIKIGLAATIASSAIFATSASAQDLEIRWGTSPGYKPFIYKNADGSLTGFDYEIGAALCAEMNAKCTWVEQAWDGIIPGLMADNYDAILASMSITPARQEVIDFTGRYQLAPVRFVGKSGMEFDDDGDLAGVTIGVQRGTTFHDYVKANFPNADIKAYPKQDEVWLDLNSGRLDVTMVSSLVAAPWIATDDGAGYEFVGKVYDDPVAFGSGAGIAVRKEDNALRDKISDAILAIRANGEYARINALYFDFDIYGPE